MNNGVLYRCNSNSERIFDVATHGLLWLAPTAIGLAFGPLEATAKSISAAKLLSKTRAASRQ
jgi:hypothetical protein